MHEAVEKFNFNSALLVQSNKVKLLSCLQYVVNQIRVCIEKNKTVTTVTAIKAAQNCLSLKAVLVLIDKIIV